MVRILNLTSCDVTFTTLTRKSTIRIAAMCVGSRRKMTGMHPTWILGAAPPLRGVNSAIAFSTT
jgi:hypothetical protein